MFRSASAACLALCLCARLIFATSPAAADDGGRARFAAGETAFASGDYAAAAVAFAAALQAGVDGPSVIYNLAVAHFRAGDLGAADEYFLLLSDRYPTMRPLSEYNQGLSDNRRGRIAAARQHFLLAYRGAVGDRKLRILASTMLARTEGKERPVNRRWHGAVGLRAGYDDNVALLDERVLPPGSAADSSAIDLFAQIASADVSDRGLRFDAAVYAVRYPDANDFDQAGVDLRIAHEWRLRDLNVTASIGAATSTLGGETFDRRLRGGLEAEWFFADRSRLALAFGAENVSSGSTAFRQVDGERRLASIDYRWRGDVQDWTIGWATEQNDRRGAGVSAARTRWRAGYRYRIEDRYRVGVNLERRKSEFDELLPARREDLVALRAFADWLPSARWLVTVSLTATDNASNDAVFGYERQVAMLGAMWLF